MVGGVDNRILKAAGIPEVQVESAVLGLVGGSGPGADVGLELVEAVGDDLVNVSVMRIDIVLL